MRWLPLLVLTPFLGLAPALASAQAAPSASSAASTASSVDGIVKGVEATYKDVESIQASFTQVTVNTMMGDEVKQEGTVEIKRPRKMRWDFAEPKSSFVTDGSTMWIYTAADNQVLVQKDLGAGGGGDDMSQLLSGLDKLGELFDTSQLEAPAGSVKLQLKPKGQANFKALELTLSEEGYVLQKVVMIDPFDNRTELSFRDVKLNAGLDDARFVFEVPAGATVVETGS